MELTSEQCQKFIKYLGDKWSKDKQCCPLCGNDKWTISKTVFGLKVLNRNQTFSISKISEIARPEPVHPVIPISCNNCGYTIFINAVIANIIDRNGEPEK